MYSNVKVASSIHQIILTFMSAPMVIFSSPVNKPHAHSLLIFRRYAFLAEDAKFMYRLLRIFFFIFHIYVRLGRSLSNRIIAIITERVCCRLYADEGLFRNHTLPVQPRTPLNTDSDETTSKYTPIQTAW